MNGIIICAMWLVFNNGDTQSGQMADNPTPPVVLPTQTAYPWTIQNNDTYPFNYVLQNGVVVYNPPVAPTPVPQPNVQAFEDAIWNDTTITPVAKLQLSLFFPLIEKRYTNPVVLKQGWQMLVSVSGSSWLDQATQNTVLGYAKQFLIPLV